MRKIECMEKIPPEQFDLDIADDVPIRQVTLQDNWRPTIQDAQAAVGFPLRAPTYVPAGAEFAIGYQKEIVRIAESLERAFQEAGDRESRAQGY